MFDSTCSPPFNQSLNPTQHLKTCITGKICRADYQSVSTCRFQGRYAEQEKFSLSFNHPPPLTSLLLRWHKCFPKFGWSNFYELSIVPCHKTGSNSGKISPTEEHIWGVSVWKCAIGNPLEIIKVENKSIGHSRKKSRHEKHFEEEENIFHPSHYSPIGCPTLPIAFAGAYILLLKL